MHKSLAAGMTAVLVAGAAMATAGPAAASQAHSGSGLQTVAITSNASGLHLGKNRIGEGTTSFKISTSNANGLDVTLVKPRHGVSLAQVAADAAEEFNPATGASGVRHLVRDAVFYGFAAARPGTRETATVTLDEGTYYLADTSSDAPPTAASFLKFKVVEDRDGDSENR